ncbi:MAG: TetR/AcrR family transcriptional regulator [Chitinophagales bacterium]|nr:TetR/AcrR family transcriptional regulator [Chitinophagales bacterium]MCZ2392488.1 TetR/AcrR family transcriptional regulator [Chitinophagales bacterium]
MQHKDLFVSKTELNIVEVASQLFIRNGIRSVTVERIVKELGISKKTIYQYFASKEELVSACVSEVLNKKKEEIDRVTSQGGEPISEMLELGGLNVETFKSFSKNTIQDLRMYYPKAWELVNEFKVKTIHQYLIKNINDGIISGDYRPNLQSHIVAYIYISLLDSVMVQHSVLKTNITLDTVYKEHLLMHIYSICTSQGKEKLELQMIKKG